MKNLRGIDVGRMHNIKKVYNNEYHVSEESMEELDMEKPKLFAEDQHLLDPYKNLARLRHRT